MQAICIAYMMLGKTDPMGTAASIYKGYLTQMDLTPDEKEILPCLVAARLVQVSLCCSSCVLLSHALSSFRNPMSSGVSDRHTRLGRVCFGAHDSGEWCMSINGCCKSCR